MGDQSDPPTGVGILSGSPLRALWHFNGAGVDFRQRSRKAEGGMSLRFYPREEPGKQGGNNPGAVTNPPGDREDAAERLRPHASTCGKKKKG